MKSKRKHIGHELYPSGRSNSKKNYKTLSTKRKNLTNILNNFKLDKQLKDNKAKLDQQLKLLKENNAMLINYVKSLKLQNEKLNKEQFREYCNDRKLENLFLKLGGIERYLKIYYHQLRKAIKEHENSNCQIETTNLLSKKILDKNLENVESTASCAIQEESKKDISVAPSVILADSFQMSTQNPSNNSRSKKLSKNSSVKRFRRKNSVENIIMRFLNSVPQYKDRKSLIENEKMDKIKKNKSKEKVKRQGSWPSRISTVVKTKRMGAKARRMLLRKLDKLSPAVKSHSRSTNNNVKQEGIQRSISNDNALTKLKRQTANGFGEKNVHNKYIESSSRKSVKSDRKKRKNKRSIIKRKHALEKPARGTIFSLTPRKFDGGTSDSMDSISWDWTVPPPQTLNNAATKIIDSLFRIPGIGLSKNKRRKIVQPHLFENKFTPHYEKSVLHQVDDIFYDLVEKNNEWQAYVRDLDGGENIIKSHLNEHYIENLRAVLQNQVNRIAQQNSDEDHIKKAKEPWSLFTWGSLNITTSTSSELSFQNRFKKKFLADKTLDMHRSLFSSEMEKLENEYFSKNIERLCELIMAREWPVDHADRQLLSEYARDPQHYNILIMAHEQRSPQATIALNNEILVDNFLYIMQLKDSERRRKKMMESKSFESNIAIDTALSYEDEGIQIRREADLNNSYVAEQRAKWAKYFALREKSPMEQYLDEKKKQKMGELAAIRNNRKQRRMDAKRILKNSRPLSDLYTAPRLTNRMQKAINDMADKEAQSILRKTKRSIKTDNSKSSLDSNMFPDNTSYRSCCSKCNIWPKEKCFLKATPLCPDPVTISFKNCNMDKKSIPDF